MLQRARRLVRVPRGRWLVAGVALLVMAAGGGAWLWLGNDPAQAQSITATATVGEVTRTVSASGTLEPANAEELGFDVSGTVEEVFVELGDTVKEGQRLARVDRTVLDAELEAAESTYTAAQDDLDDASGGSSTALAAAQAQYATARDDLDAAREAVADAVLRAPFAGQVVSLDLAVGDVVGSGGGASSGGSTSSVPGAATTTSATTSGTVQVASVSSFTLDATVGSSDVESIKEGLQAEVTATGVDGTLYGTVTEVGRVAETSSSGSAAFPVTIELTGKSEGVYGGTAATAAIIVEKRTDVLTVPTRAVKSDGDTTYVDLVGKDGAVVKQTIEIGETYGQSTEVLKGLEDGDTIQLVALSTGAPGGGDRSGMPGGGELPSGFPGGDFPAGGFPAGGFPGGAP